MQYIASIPQVVKIFHFTPNESSEATENMEIKTEIPGSSKKPEKAPSVISLSDSEPETEPQTEINLDQIETPITIEQTDDETPGFVATPVEKARRKRSDRLSQEQLKELMLKGQIPFEPPKLIDVIGKLEIGSTH